jgi:hypothetical protein
MVLVSTVIFVSKSNDTHNHILLSHFSGSRITLPDLPIDIPTKILYNVTGHLITSDHQLYNVTPLKTPFRLLIGLFTIFTFVREKYV